MRIIIDGHGRIDRQAMAVERLKTALRLQMNMPKNIQRL